MKITFISDTHSKHNRVTDDLMDGGDVIIHSGDISSMGYEHEVLLFLQWFDKLPYDRKIFVAGNHDYYFEQYPGKQKEILSKFPDITYLQDSHTMLGEEWEDYRVKVWGSPWQPRFYNWAFNLDRNSDEIEEKWKMIPDDTDILVTHGPPHGILDWVAYDHTNAGCERMKPIVDLVKPKVHVFGHIHQGYGMTEENGTIFLNASVLNGRYDYANKPVNIDYNRVTGKVTLL